VPAVPDILLPLYFVLYFTLAFVLPSVRVARRTGHNPVVIPRDETPYGIVGRYFRLTLVGLLVYVIAHGFVPAVRPHLLPLEVLSRPGVAMAGWALLLGSLAWTVAAQWQMRDSWRVGIDTDVRTELVAAGLFRISRNPIFLGMTLSLAGVFLITPNAVTLLLLVVGHILIQIQIRLEEAFLLEQHGEAYVAYCAQVRRMI
jgi:protein-S-isoprenylcysteine O-methyltransferase Ste14